MPPVQKRKSLFTVGQANTWLCSSSPTNSGKSILVLPFDELYGFAHVFHKPALGSSFALRNLLKEKSYQLSYLGKQEATFGRRDPGARPPGSLPERFLTWPS